MIRSSLLIIALVTCSAGTAATVANVVSIAADNTGKPIPRFVNGFTVFYDRDLRSITSYGRDGVMRARTELSIPGTSAISITDVSARADGTVVAAASAVSQDQRQISSVLFWIAPNGHVDRVVKTSPFAPAKVLFDVNSNLWVAGKVYDENFRETPRHDILREYDSQGQLLRTALSSDSFKTQSHPASQMLLVANREKVGVYSRANDEYIEFDSTGKSLGRWKTPPFPKTTRIVGAALTSNGAFYAGGLTRGEDGKSVAFRFDKSTGAFVPIELPLSGNGARLLTLLGSEGNDLIVYGKPSSIIRVTPE